MRYRRVVCHELIGTALRPGSSDFSGRMAELPVSGLKYAFRVWFQLKGLRHQGLVEGLTEKGGGGGMWF